MIFSLLPQELALNIFKQLDPSDAQALISKLKQFLPNINAHKAIELLYVRLYLGRTVISVSEEQPKSYDVCLSPQEFLALGNDPEFLSNIPKRLDMVFVRNVRDYTHFQHRLAEFRQILETGWALKYLANVQKLTFELNGRSVTTENPTLMLALVLNTLITLTNLGKDNLASIAVSSTDIGELFPHKWGKVLGNFTQVETLSLDDNLMRLELIAGNEPVLERHFHWPPQLRQLSLARNFIKLFTVNMVKKLPKTLESLDLSSNIIESIGLPYHERFSLSEELPLLKLFSLHDNRYLVLVDPGLLDGEETSGQITVDIRGCNLHEEAFGCFLESAVRNAVNLLSDESSSVNLRLNA